MIAFLPVARYGVEYQVACGRPFSSFERLMLAAIHGGNGTLELLADLFRLHRRMVIEGVVTLMQAGWVCLAPDGSSFITTDSGRMACAESEELPATIVVSNRSSTLLLEKVCGQLARGSDLTLYTKQKLGNLWNAGVPITPGDISNVIEPGMITHLLAHDPGEWVRLVGPISVVTDNRLYAIVDVDTTAGKLAGIPRGWEALLRDELVERVRRAEARLAETMNSEEEKELQELLALSSAAEVGQLTEWTSAVISAEDILTTSDEHAKMLTSVLQGAQSYVGIVSSSLAGGIVADNIAQLSASLDRGLLISVSWGPISGGIEGDHSRGLEMLKKLESDSNQGKHRGRLLVNAVNLASSFNALVSDHSGGVQVVFGSFSWLSSPASGIEKHVSIRLANCAVGAKFCDFIADLAAREEKIRISGAVTSLRKAAATLREVAAVANRPAGTDPESLMANVFFGEAGDWYCSELIEYATTSVSITVSSIDPGQAAEASKQLSSAATRVSERVTIEFGGAPLEPSLSSPLMSNETDVAFVARPEMRANVIVVDGRSLLIGNRSWFDNRESRVRPYGSRVALAIQGPGIPGMTEARLGFSNSK